MNHKPDILIIGCGVIGLTIARTIKQRKPDASIVIIDKESSSAFHASSRNSGVLHAGFYYTADSLKARFTVEGSRAMRQYCAEKNLPVNMCGKLVVAQNEEERQVLKELEARGKRNGSDVELVDEVRAREIDPNVKTHKQALYSPQTASINPKAVCQSLEADLKAGGVEFSFSTHYIKQIKGVVETSAGTFEAKHVVNCAGLYADQVAHDFGFGKAYTMMPFKGLYLKYTKNKTDVKVNIYPVPNLKNPFLGVHFTKTVDGDIKIGPTAIPALWRENYQGTEGFNLKEFTQIAGYQTRLFLTNSFNFRDLAFEEMRKYNKVYFIRLAQNMVQSIDPKGFTEYTAPGIRAQLLDKENLRLVQDFVVEGDHKSTHVLNAVSPAFTCAFVFADHVVTTRVAK